MDQFRFEPTVLRATRRHRVAVSLVVGLSTAIGLALPLLQDPEYVATAGLTMPLPANATEQTSGPFLDDQVLLLKSSAVADRAAEIVAAEFGPDAPGVGDFLGDTPAFEVTPPESGSSGSYGASTVLVSFTWPDARIAAAGVNAGVQAFTEVRSELIRTRGDATAAALQKAADETPPGEQRDTLLAQRSQVFADQQIDLINLPTAAGGVLPETPSNRDWMVGAAIGLLLGLLVGPTLAYTWASLRGGFDDASEPAGFYGVPLLGTIDTRRDRRWWAPRWRPRAQTYEEDMRFAAAALDHTRTSLDRGRIVVAVAPRGAEVTGAIVAGVAHALVEGGRRVLVIAADPADPTVTDLLGAGATGPGLAEIVAGSAVAPETVHPSPRTPGLSVVGPGAAHGPGAGVAGAAYRRAVAAAFTELTPGFDLVLVAAPGLLDTALAGELAGAGDATVLVLGRREPARDHLVVAQRLELSETIVLGYVFLPAVPARHGAPRVQEQTEQTEQVVATGGRSPTEVPRPAPEPRVPVLSGADGGAGSAAVPDGTPTAEHVPGRDLNGSRPTPFRRDRD